MSRASSTPQPLSRSLTPASANIYSPISSYTPPIQANGSVSTLKSSTSKTKPANVFSNDGSFLERFQRNRKEEDEKKKQQEELLKKRNFDERFKNRGKRRAPPPEPTENTSEESPNKKVKSDKPMTEYEKELKTYSGSLKDVGTGIRPLVK